MRDLDRLCSALSQRGFSIQLVSIEFAERLFRQASIRRLPRIEPQAAIGPPSSREGAPS